MINENSAEALVYESLRSMCGSHEYKTSTSFVCDLGFDSLDMIKYCLELEQRADCYFNDAEISSFTTVGDVIEAVKRKNR